MKTHVLLLLAAGMLLGGCKSNEVANSGDVKQHTIHQDYKVLVDEAHNTTDVYATYRFGGANGTTLVLTPPAAITFDGKPLQKSENVIIGAYYWNTVAELKKGEHAFVYTDTDGKKHKNTLHFAPLKIDSMPRTVNSGSPLVLKITTTPLLQGEKLYVQLRDTAGAVDSVVEKLDSNYLTLPAETLVPLAQKIPVYIKLVRSYKSPLQEGTQEGGKLYVEYTLKERRFIITP